MCTPMLTAMGWILVMSGLWCLAILWGNIQRTFSGQCTHSGYWTVNPAKLTSRPSASTTRIDIPSYASHLQGLLDIAWYIFNWTLKRRHVPLVYQWSKIAWISRRRSVINRHMGWSCMEPTSYTSPNHLHVWKGGSATHTTYGRKPEYSSHFLWQASSSRRCLWMRRTAKYTG